MRELALKQSNQSKKAEIVNYFYQWEISKSSGKRKAKRSFTVSVKTPKGTGERSYRNGPSPWFCEKEVNHRAFVSINRMRAGHSSLKASLS
jgi:uncharacterized GH25 family protein